MSHRRPSRKPPAPLVTPRAVVALPLDERLRPWLLAAVVAAYVARTLTVSESSAAESGSGLPWVMLWLVLALSWGAAAVFSRRLAWRFKLIDLAAMAVLLCVTISSLVALRTEAPRPTLNMLWEWIGMGMGFLLLRQLLRTASEGRAVLAVMVCLAVGHSSFAGYQRFVSLPRDQARYRADPEAALREAELTAPPGSPARKAFEDRLLYSHEPFSTFALTNSLAGYLAPWLIVGLGIVGLGWPASSPPRWPGWQRGVVAILLVAVACCLYLTKSRAGLAAAVVGLVLLSGLWFRRRSCKFSGKQLTAAILAATVLTATGLATAGLNRDLLAGARKSLGYRLEYWKASAKMIADHPLLGVGAGNFGAWYPQYKLPQAKEEIQDPHNFLVELASCSGLWAALAMVVLMAAITIKAWRIASPSPDADEGLMAEGSPFAQPQSDGWRFILWGGLAGCPLSLLSALSGFLWPGWTALAWIAPALAVTLWCLRPWVNSGTCPPALAVIGCLVLLVNLLAAGGIAYPSVANTLWLLAAVAATQCEGFSPPRLAPRNALPAVALTIAALTVACLKTSYQPVIVSRQALAMFESEVAAGRLIAAWAELRAAAVADPRSAVPWQVLQQVSFEDWRRSNSPAAFAEFERASAQCLRQVPRSNLAWRQVGLDYLAAFQRTGQKELADQAVRHLTRSAELYPSSADRWARLALALDAAGDTTAAASAATQALELHKQTPHQEMRLPTELFEQLQRKL